MATKLTKQVNDERINSAGRYIWHSLFLKLVSFWLPLWSLLRRAYFGAREDLSKQWIRRQNDNIGTYQKVRTRRRLTASPSYSNEHTTQHLLPTAERNIYSSFDRPRSIHRWPAPAAHVTIRWPNKADTSLAASQEGIPRSRNAHTAQPSIRLVAVHPQCPYYCSSVNPSATYACDTVLYLLL